MASFNDDSKTSSSNSNSSTNSNNDPITIHTIHADGGYADLVPYLLDNRPVLVAFPASTMADMTAFSRDILVVNKGMHSDGSSIHVSVERCAPAGGATDASYARARQATTLDAFLREAADGDAGAPCNGYLKDWHIDRVIASHASQYFAIPDAFQDDWLNWYWQNVRGGDDDYSFAYLGGHATTTLVHHDVACSYSWSVNVSGTKRWTLWPPRAAHALLRRPETAGGGTHTGGGGSRGSDESFNEGVGDFALINDARTDERARHGAVDVLQGVGQALFVPSGWYHQVENVAESSHNTGTDATPAAAAESSGVPPSLVVSLNRNWYNGFSVHEVWLFIVRELTAVRKELWHMRPGTDVADADPSLHMGLAEWYRQCDAILKANAATNARELLELLSARVRMMTDAVQSLRVSQEVAAEGDALPQAPPSAGPAWAGVFCPRYNPPTPPRPADVALSRAQMRAPVPHAQPRGHLLSTYHTAIARHDHDAPWSLFPPGRALCPPVPTGHRYPTTVWSHTCSEIRRVVDGMLDSDEFVAHLDCVATVGGREREGEGVEKEDVAGDGIARQALEALRSDVVILADVRLVESG